MYGHLVKTANSKVEFRDDSNLILVQNDEISDLNKCPAYTEKE